MNDELAVPKASTGWVPEFRWVTGHPGVLVRGEIPLRVLASVCTSLTVAIIGASNEKPIEFGLRTNAVRLLKLKYLLALLAIGAVSVAGSLIMTREVKAQRGAAEVINVSGRQRMLSQRILFLLNSAPLPETEVLVGDAVGRFERSVHWLEHPPWTGTPSESTAAANAANLSFAFLNAVARARAGDAAGRTEAERLARGPLLEALEAQVSFSRDAAEAGLDQMVAVERWVLGAVVLALVLEALLVFWPLSQRLTAAFRELEQTVTTVRDRERQQRELTEAAGDGYAVINADGHFVSPPSAKLQEWFPKCLEAPFFEAVVPAETAQDAIGLLQRVQAGTFPGTRWMIELPQLIKREGSTFQLSYQARSTAPLELLVVMRDVSAVGLVYEAERRRTAAEQQARVAAAERLVSLGTLAAGIAHEVNNPTAWIRSNTEFALSVLQERNDDSLNEVKSSLTETLDGANRIIGIVKDMRLLSRRSDDGGQPIDVKDTIERVLRLARSELKMKAVVETEFGATPMTHIGDGQLAQVVLNLVMNAAQAMPERNAGESRVVVKSCKTGDGQVSIEVADNGTGIPAAVQSRLFTPFFTTKPAGSGTGLGLAISHAIITGRGGSLTFTSSPGHTVFRIVLPAAAQNQL